MGGCVVDQVVKLMTCKRINVVDSNILIMGFTFKENCSDFRNTRVIDLINGCKEFHCNVDAYDPWVDKSEVRQEYGITLIDSPKEGYYDTVVIAVFHNEYKKLGVDKIKKLTRNNNIIYDVKSILPGDEVDGRL